MHLELQRNLDHLLSNTNVSIKSSFLGIGPGIHALDVELNSPVSATLLYPISRNLKYVFVAHEKNKDLFPNSMKLFGKEYYARTNINKLSLNFDSNLEAAFVVGYLDALCNIPIKKQEYIVDFAFDESRFGSFKKRGVSDRKGIYDLLHEFDISFDGDLNSVSNYLKCDSPLKKLTLDWYFSAVKIELDQIALPSIPFPLKDMYAVHVTDNVITDHPIDFNIEPIAYDVSKDILPFENIAREYFYTTKRTSRWSIQPSNTLDLITSGYFFQKVFPGVINKSKLIKN